MAGSPSHGKLAELPTLARQEPAAAIVAEAMVRLALMKPVLEKYGGDSLEETLDNLARSTQAGADLFARDLGANVQ